MLISKEIVFIASVLCFTSVTAVTNLFKSHKFPDKRLYHDRSSFEKTDLVYAVCDKSGLDDVSKACKVTLEKHSFEKESQKNECDINLKVKRDNHRFYSMIRVIKYGEDKAIVMWWEIPKSLIRDRMIRGDTYLKTVLVNFPSCKYVENELAMRGNEDDIDYALSIKSSIVPRGNLFDVVYPSKTDCAEKLCMSTFDTKNKKVKGPTAFLPVTNKSNIISITPVELKSTLEYVYIDYKSDRSPTTFFIYKNNDSIPLSDHFEELVYLFYEYSTANDLITFCAIQPKNKFECVQFDYDAKLKHKTTVNLESPAHRLAVHNARDGGFLIFTYEGNQSVTKYDASGKKIGSVEVEFPKCGEDYRVPWAKFFENKENNQICLAYTCVYTFDELENTKGLLDWSAKCFVEKELA